MEDSERTATPHDLAFLEVASPASASEAAAPAVIPPSENTATAWQSLAALNSGSASGFATANSAGPGCTGFTFDDFSSLDGLDVVGSAAQSGNRLRLTEAVGGQAGAAWFRERQFVEAGFETTFQFQFTLRTNPNGAGITFTIQNDQAETSALGGSGGNLGYGDGDGRPAIANSLVVEFDNFRNPALGDRTPNHISVHTAGPLPNSALESYSLGWTGGIPALDNTQVHTARVRYTPGVLQVYVDDLTTPRLTVSVDLAATLHLNDGHAFVGFTSATGGSWQRHDILSWSFAACPVCADLYYPDFGFTDGLQLNGDAFAVDSRLRLTRAQQGQEGSAWLTARQFVAAGFDTTFQFQFTGRSRPASADGITFTVQNSEAGALALGGGGGNLGYGGPATPLANSLVVEFDTYFNRGLADPNGNHISIHTQGALPNSAHESASIGSTTDIPNMKDDQVHTARLSYTPGVLNVFLDDLETPRLSIALDLTETLNLTQGHAWVGFTSSTGTYWERHDLLNWWFTSCVS